MLVVVTALFAAYDVVQDAREALNFSFGVQFFDNCKRTERRPVGATELAQREGWSPLLTEPHREYG